MNLVVRPAQPGDPCSELLFASARPYYTAYFGSEETAVSLLKAVWPKLGHAASYEYCHVALDDGAPVGVMAGFPVSEGDRLSRRFIAMTVFRMAWRLPA